MQMIFYFLCMFFAFGILMSLVVVLRDNDLSELLPVYKPNKKKVASSYWGAYTGDDIKESDSILLPKITDYDAVNVIGSEVYSKGKPVKSLRR